MSHFPTIIFKGIQDLPPPTLIHLSKMFGWPIQSYWNIIYVSYFFQFQIFINLLKMI